jgi:hypothetical protein
LRERRTAKEDAKQRKQDAAKTKHFSTSSPHGSAGNMGNFTEAGKTINR